MRRSSGLSLTACEASQIDAVTLACLELEQERRASGQGVQSRAGEIEHVLRLPRLIGRRQTARLCPL